MSFLLDAYAARTCAVKTQHRFNPRVPSTSKPEDPGLAELFDGGQAWTASVLEYITTHFTDCCDLRPLKDKPASEQNAACLAAMQAGTEVIIAGLLPADTEGHRISRPDLWVRCGTRADGRASYWPVLIKFHRVHEKQRSGRENHWSLDCSPLADPRPSAAVAVADLVFRNQRAPDLIQAAHSWRLALTSGFSEQPGRVGVIGTDPVREPAEAVVTWVDLETPTIRTYSRANQAGWTRRSVLERYDHEHSFRVKVAEAALAQGTAQAPELLVHPIVTSECRRCPYWESCLTELDADDISLRLDRAPLDVREIAVLRQAGILTIADLAKVDLADFLPQYLPEVRHRGDGESRLRHAARRADMLARGITLERSTSTDIFLPEAEVEIDFDIETSNADRVYLWGFWVLDRRSTAAPYYRAFVSWEDLDDQRETELAAEALTWLRSVVESAPTAQIYHYSDYEVVRLRRLAERSHRPEIAWACSQVGRIFVDLYAIIKQHWFGTSGLGLKVVATEGAGFDWRDDNPGGFNSLGWFDDAAHAEDPATRAAARRRVLEYNEDDVRATAAVRAWIRRF